MLFCIAYFKKCIAICEPRYVNSNPELSYFDLLFGSRSVADFFDPLGDIIGSGSAVFDPLAGGEADELEEVYNVN